MKHPMQFWFLLASSHTCCLRLLPHYRPEFTGARRLQDPHACNISSAVLYRDVNLDLET